VLLTLYITCVGASVLLHVPLPPVPLLEQVAGVVVVAGFNKGWAWAGVVPGPLCVTVGGIITPAPVPEPLTGLQMKLPQLESVTTVTIKSSKPRNADFVVFFITPNPLLS
jgi:hypothetical protein